MKEYVVSREDLRKWCSIPVDELADHPDRKMNLMMGEDKTARRNDPHYCHIYE